MDPWSVLKYPYMTEKSISMVQRENKIVFIVNRKSTKEEIKKAFERLFEVKVKSINILITKKGEKKAFIKVSPQFKAIDVATKLGMV